jgi:hypothetical protein
MKKTVVGVVSAATLMTGGLATIWATAARPSQRTITNADQQTAAPAPQIHFWELLEPGPKLKPGAKARELNGNRVRLIGYMPDMELPPTGAFYLVPRPLKLDEAGAGTADLPLESVLVTSPALEGRTWASVGGPLEAVGTLEVGNQSDAQGRVSNFRLKLDAEAAASINRIAHN